MTTFSTAEIKAIRRKPTAEERLEMNRRAFCDRVNFGQHPLYRSAALFPNGDVNALSREDGKCYRIPADRFADPGDAEAELAASEDTETEV